MSKKRSKKSDSDPDITSTSAVPLWLKQDRERAANAGAAIGQKIPEARGALDRSGPELLITAAPRQKGQAPSPDADSSAPRAAAEPIPMREAGSPPARRNTPAAGPPRAEASTPSRSSFWKWFLILILIVIILAAAGLS